MNFTLIYTYSKICKNKRKITIIKILKNLFSLLNIFIYPLGINNDFSFYSFVVLNLFITTEFYENNVNNFRRNLIRKEFAILKSEVDNLFLSTKFYKNFKYWNNLKWLIEKEFISGFFFSVFLLRFGISEPRNFHFWSFFLNFFNEFDIKFFKKITFVDLVLSFDNFNDTLWQLNFLILTKVPTQEFDCLNSILMKKLNFFFESKFKFLKKTSKYINFMKFFSLFLSINNFFV
nr:farnesyltransferase/geranylgeranyltransferase type-1 subunit alpha [Cryptomonas curvata]